MKTRGEKQYINMPSFAARLYDNLTSVKGVNKSFEEIAFFITSFLKHGKLLDIGTGPGRLLYEINKCNPQIELYGLDISEAMLEIARKNLQSVNNIDLCTGNIVKTDYQDNLFDCIVSTGSFYNWDRPVDGLNEIYRILKPGTTAYIFESYKDHNKEIFCSHLKANLKGYNIFRKALSKYFLMKQLKMTYSIKDFDDLIKQTKFYSSYKIHQIELGNLPIYLKIELRKHEQYN